VNHLKVESMQQYGVLPVLLRILDLIQLNDHAGAGRGLRRNNAGVDGGIVPLLFA
jgi:hypothetical protein